MKSIDQILKQEKFILLFIFLVYITLPTNNSSLDAYYYAASVKYGENLFSPHHLLYSAFIHLLYKPLYFLNLDILWFSKLINTSFSILTLYILFKILQPLKPDKKEINLYLFIAAFSFGIWRYSTENETYILPIFFSLLASYQFLIYLERSELFPVFLCAVFSAMACLFHQLHFLWWVGLLAGILMARKNLTHIFLYGFIGLLVPIAYITVLKINLRQEITLTNVLQFVFHDFYSGSASSQFDSKNVILTLINSIRTFFQLHPNIGILIKKNVLYGLPVLGMLYLLYVLSRALIKKNLLVKSDLRNNLFITSHTVIFLLYFFFALYSVGNIEFMVTFPFLLLLTFLLKYTINTKILSLAALTLFIWNFAYAIFPNYKYDYYNDDQLLNFINENPNKLFIVKNADLKNKYYYQTGINNYENMIIESKITSKKEIDSILKSRKEIYTDVIDKPSILNREKIMSSGSYSINFDDFKKEKVLSYQGLYGTSIIYRIQRSD